MQILISLNSIASRLKSHYVVIGGHAINAHGYSRSTGDLDLAISLADAEQWKANIAALGYACFHEQPAFVQYRAERLDAWPIDLMLLDDVTFKKMLADSIEFEFRDCKAQIATIPHLISMKLHASKGRILQRESKDLADIVELLKLGSFANCASSMVVFGCMTSSMQRKPLSLKEAFLDLPIHSEAPPVFRQGLPALTVIEMSEQYLVAQNSRSDFEEFRRAKQIVEPFWL